MAELFVLGASLVGLIAASMSKNETENNIPPPPSIPEKVYIPQGSQDEHPGNLPTVTPVYGNPETAPEMANTREWDFNEPRTGSFEDAFHSLRIDRRPSDIKNTYMPHGLLPQFRQSTQAPLYIEPLQPSEFKPPKTELYNSEATETPFVKQSGVLVPPQYANNIGRRYATMSKKENGPSGAFNDYTLWNTTESENCDDETNPELRDWYGAKTVTERFEGVHPRVRIFPRKERYMSTKQQFYNRPEHPFSHSQSVSGRLGRLELPDNLDVTEYTRAPLPNKNKGEQPIRIARIELNRTERPSTNLSWAPQGLLPLNETADVGDGGRFTDINPHVRRVVPDIRQVIDQDLIQPYMSNPYTPSITNLAAPNNCSGELPATQMTDDLPAYTMVK